MYRVVPCAVTPATPELAEPAPCAQLGGREDNDGPDTLIAPICLRAMLTETLRLGIDPQALFQGLGFSAPDLALPAFRVSQAEAAKVVRRALLLIDDPNLGIKLGVHSQIMDRGVMALGLMASKNLGQAIALTLRFPHSAGFLLTVREQVSELNPALLAEPFKGSSDLEPFLVDKLFTGMVSQYRQITGADYAPQAIELVRARPANALAYAQFFKCPVRFGALRNRLVNTTAWLSFPLPLAHVMSYDLSCELLAGQRLARSDRVPLHDAVERAIRSALPLIVTPQQVAASLNLSQRTLRRRLEEQGISFSELLDAGRMARALELIVSGHKTMGEVADQTGFADARNFRRAFKRWTGLLPSDTLSPASLDEVLLQLRGKA